MTRSSTPVRVGVAGCGFIGQTVGGDFQWDDRASLVAIAEVDDETRESVGDDFGLPATGRYDDYGRMLAEADLDAVLVATPHTLHYEQVVAAMDRGLHVLCEKPLATDLADARDLTDRAESGQEVLMVGYQRHLEDGFRKARKRWASGDAEPRFVTAEITQRWIEGVGGTWRTDADHSGGGFLYDTGSHILDAICWTTGLTPDWVSAEMTFHDDARRVDSRALVTIGFEGGATATVSVFGDAPAVREHIHIWDDDGAVYLDGREWEPRRYREVDADSTTTTPYVRPSEWSKAQAFLDAVVEGRDPPATARDALVVTAITEAAYESARTGRKVDLSL
ncbi:MULTISPECIES: Gfo/Idh/MocA family protein [Haloarcula]|uniref:Gfo/Idh/MocA family protein n=1 Tax=Haloarcula TaxID=2237 RepID=UPI0023ECD02D|nr:Gfo/Idh/MocA family oxidoreductase [Halomicroarcula sp. XH51]